MRLVADALSALRALLALPLVWALAVGDQVLALVVFAVAALSDVLDGRLARRSGRGGGSPRARSRGAYLDVGADAVFLLSGLTASWARGALPAWVPLVAVAMVVRFFATSPAGSPLYDPVGRHCGTLLYVVLGVWLLDPAPAVRGAVLVVLGLATAASLLGRTWFLRRRADAVPGAPGGGRRP